MIADVRDLTSCEARVLTVLDDRFMSPSVIKVRAGYASSCPSAVIHQACLELQKRGLAEHAGSGRRSHNRWRRCRMEFSLEAIG